MHDAIAKTATPLKMGIRAIYIEESSMKLCNDFDPTIGGQELTAEFRVGHVQPTIKVRDASKIVPARTVSICHSFEFRYVLDAESAEGASSKEVAAITATVAVNYQHDDADAPSEAQLGDWAITNAVQHVWPYWREFCHSSLIRMHLPVVMVPLLNIVHNPRAIEPEALSVEAKNRSKGKRALGKKSSS